jgi:hypothetical protein
VASASTNSQHNIMQHSILHCKGQDLSKFIRYASYCDEFCNEDFTYFSAELIKCKCDFFSYVEKLKNKEKLLKINNFNDNTNKGNKDKANKNSNEKDEEEEENGNKKKQECIHRNKIDRYEIFANSYDLSKTIYKYESNTRPIESNSKN